MIPKIHNTAHPLRTAAIAACRRVYKSDPTPNPSPREGLMSAYGGNQGPVGPCHL